MCVRGRTVVDLSRVVAQWDDLHPLLSVQVVVQLLRRQFVTCRCSFPSLLAAAAALHAGRHHPHSDPPTALLFGLMEEPCCWVVTLLVLRGHDHHQISSCSYSWSSGAGTHRGQRLPKQCNLLGDGQLGEPCGGGDGGGWGESCSYCC